MSFQVHAKDLLGRVGTLKTRSGAISTPHMFPVLEPYHRLLEPQLFQKVGIRGVMTNAYLMKRGQRSPEPPDVHSILSFSGCVATDSGAYQILEYGEVGIKPEEIVHYQERINSDIGVILDVPTGFRSDPIRARWTVDETLRRADQALKIMSRSDILWMGPVQGGVHLSEVERSAAEMSRRDFPIYALGSPTELMESQRYDILIEMIFSAKKRLPPGKPFHLFGAGHPTLFPFLVAMGCDLFDSAAYALYARAGRYLTSEGTQLLGDMTEFVCSCSACSDSSPAEVMSEGSKDRESRLAQHNLWACFSELRRIREAIRRGRLWDLLETRARCHPALMDCFQRIQNHSDFLERFTPAVKPHGIFHISSSSEARPEAIRFRSQVSHSVVEKPNVLLVLPGRWRRPFHEDPRYQIVVKSFDDTPYMSICFYSPTWGLVPIELDETFPIAQTEGRDLGDPDLYQVKAMAIAARAKTFRAILVILVSDGDFGKQVATQMRKSFGKTRFVLLDGEKLKPLGLIKYIERKISRTR